MPDDAAAPGTPGNPLKLTDPRMMRALAHPARLAILARLALEGPATATECAEAAGMSPSACSYHLRALASYGFVEEDPASAADGRQRPWRARIFAVSFGDEPGQPSAVRAAGHMLSESVRASLEEIRERFTDRQSEYSAEWQAVAGLHQDVMHVTPAEAHELTTRLHELIAPYRRLEPAERPPGARRVNVVLDFVPWFEPDQAP